MRDKDWKYRAGTEARYQRGIGALGQKAVAGVKKLDSVEAIIDHLLRQMREPWFQEYAFRQALWMVRTLAHENAGSWREAAKRSQGGRAKIIHQLLKTEMAGSHKFGGLIAQNAELIKTIPQSVATRITKLASQEAIAGRRGAEIIKRLQWEAPHLAEWQARLIARTEVAKTQATITQVRAQQIGVDWFVWQTSQDQRVRSSHKHMQGVACQYSNPPEPEVLDGLPSQGHYCPGGIYNCRCYAAPIIDLDFTPFPLKVVQGGRIVSIRSRRAFKAIQ